jgi:hypothetical protein
LSQTRLSPPQTGDRAIYWDIGLPGFGLMVTKSGHRSYCVQYRTLRGESRRMHLKDVLSLSAARQWAKVQLGEVAKGSDPLGEKRKAAEAAAAAQHQAAAECL